MPSFLTSPPHFLCSSLKYVFISGALLHTVDWIVWWVIHSLSWLKWDSVSLSWLRRWVTVLMWAVSKVQVDFADWQGASVTDGRLRSRQNKQLCAGDRCLMLPPVRSSLYSVSWETPGMRFDLGLVWNDTEIWGLCLLYFITATGKCDWKGFWDAAFTFFLSHCNFLFLLLLWD